MKPNWCSHFLTIFLRSEADIGGRDRRQTRKNKDRGAGNRSPLVSSIRPLSIPVAPCVPTREIQYLGSQLSNPRA